MEVGLAMGHSNRGSCFFSGAAAFSLVAAAMCFLCLPATAQVCVPISVEDTTCDNVDDDCDGTVDDDFVSSGTSCGVGACGSSGSISCVGGSVEDSCTPGTPLDNDDDTCDGVDDDCDGIADEDFEEGPTGCGVGSCAATGLATCSNGMLDDSCSPGAPLDSDDDTCDQVDDDCDGDLDEDVVAECPASTTAPIMSQTALVATVIGLFVLAATALRRRKHKR